MRGAGRGSARLVVFLLSAGLLAGMLVLYTLRSRPPRLPSDPDHIQGVDPQKCLGCHGPGGRRPRGPKHPLSDRCFSCHGEV